MWCFVFSPTTVGHSSLRFHKKVKKFLHPTARCRKFLPDESSQPRELGIPLCKEGKALPVSPSQTAQGQEQDTPNPCSSSVSCQGEHQDRPPTVSHPPDENPGATKERWLEAKQAQGKEERVAVTAHGWHYYLHTASSSPVLSASLLSAPLGPLRDLRMRGRRREGRKKKINFALFELYEYNKP